MLLGAIAFEALPSCCSCLAESRCWPGPEVIQGLATGVALATLSAVIVDRSPRMTRSEAAAW